MVIVSARYALRFNLITGNSPANVMRFFGYAVKQCASLQTRYGKPPLVLMNLSKGKTGFGEVRSGRQVDPVPHDRLISEVTENLDRYEIASRRRRSDDFIWDSYCDWYIELTKSRITGAARIENFAQQVLCYVLSENLKLLHRLCRLLRRNLQALPHEAILMTSAWRSGERIRTSQQGRALMGWSWNMIRGRARAPRRNERTTSRKAKLLIVRKRREYFPGGGSIPEGLAWSDEERTGRRTARGPKGHGFRRDARSKGLYPAFSAHRFGAGTAAHREGEEEG